jgi:O-antigen/teichoic acid export membrane protein
MQLMLNTLLTAIYPMLSRIAIQDPIKFTIRIKSLLNITILFGVWASICFALFSRDLISLLFGNAYIITSKILLTQCWFTLMFAIFSIIGTVLSAYEKQRLLAILSMIYTLVSFPIFYFGSKFGAIGLSISFVIASFINMSYHWIYFIKSLEKGISIVYSIAIFSLIGILTFLTYNYEFNISLIMKFLLLIIITLSTLFYFYKTEYKNLMIDLNK